MGIYHQNVYGDKIPQPFVNQVREIQTKERLSLEL